MGALTNVPESLPIDAQTVVSRSGAAHQVVVLLAFG
jgi:hypothetical protein